MSFVLYSASILLQLREVMHPLLVASWVKPFDPNRSLLRWVIIGVIACVTCCCLKCCVTCPADDGPITVVGYDSNGDCVELDHRCLRCYCISAWLCHRTLQRESMHFGLDMVGVG